ncbi:MAG TPA: N-acetylmuramoyl-L-alanine amidase [Candidatus Limnocylindria bacterium]|jgi:N-acetylmuramoyl-L-alanine amidase|nr:N-acetylmuramoyl-L-alanine amidase [Candidatus Limnocylindria bacterium]
MRLRRELRRIRPLRPGLAIGLILVLVLAGCVGSASPSVSAQPSTSINPSAPASAGPGEVIPAPGSSSRIFAPNPRAIVVAIDPGHGGCLDWGVPNPYDNTVERSEKTLTLGISLALREHLEAEGVTVVMTRDTDVALAGDDYPPLGCEGDPFRDVNGDGEAGFGPEVSESTRTRDELAAHIDLVNLARADVLLSIHINSFTENGVVIEVAGTETYWTDETAWGVPHSERLASAIQAAVVAAIGAIAPYERQDRGIDAVNYYVIAPATTTGDPSEPRRGSLMPGVLAEVGSMSLAAEADLLASAEGQEAIAVAITDALVTWFAGRELGVRIDLAAPGGAAGVAPAVVPGTGPPYWAPSVPDPAALAIRLTNTGTAPWPAGTMLVGGWGSATEPYLARPPELVPLATAVPPLAPGESVDLEASMPPIPAGEGAIGWVTIRVGDVVLSESGIPALQFVPGRP